MIGDCVPTRKRFPLAENTRILKVLHKLQGNNPSFPFRLAFGWKKTKKIRWLAEKFHESINKQGFDGISKGGVQIRVLAESSGWRHS